MFSFQRNGGSQPARAAAVKSLISSPAAHGRRGLLFVIAVLTSMVAGPLAAQERFPGIGRAATVKEVRAWDIDVRPDFKGLPSGSGSVSQGQDIWEGKCMSCHGVFGESNEVFTPIVGGTSKDDIRTGRVARLTDESYPQRTTMMKVPTLSTLWDYIYRAMPWNQPKSLTHDEVYAVTAYILNLADVVPADFVLSDKNIRAVQQRMPNRNGTTTRHAMWAGRLASSASAVDVQGSGCMRNCATETQVASILPDYARDAHGNLAEQNRLVGAQRGAVTVQQVATAGSADKAIGAGATAGAAAGGSAAGDPAKALLAKHACVACHGMDNKLVGPSIAEVAKRYAGKGDAVEYLAARIKAGGSGVWGAIPMPAQTLPEADARQIAQWLAAGAAR